MAASRRRFSLSETDFTRRSSQSQAPGAALPEAVDSAWRPLPAPLSSPRHRRALLQYRGRPEEASSEPTAKTANNRGWHRRCAGFPVGGNAGRGRRSCSRSIVRRSATAAMAAVSRCSPTSALWRMRLRQDDAARSDVKRSRFAAKTSGQRRRGAGALCPAQSCDKASASSSARRCPPRSQAPSNRHRPRGVGVPRESAHSTVRGHSSPVALPRHQE